VRGRGSSKFFLSYVRDPFIGLWFANPLNLLLDNQYNGFQSKKDLSLQTTTRPTTMPMKLQVDLDAVPINKLYTSELHLSSVVMFMDPCIMI
jgi:hypothetical protein